MPTLSETGRSVRDDDFWHNYLEQPHALIVEATR
jgi:hypothetical protein